MGPVPRGIMIPLESAITSQQTLVSSSTICRKCEKDVFPLGTVFLQNDRWTDPLTGSGHLTWLRTKITLKSDKTRRSYSVQAKRSPKISRLCKSWILSEHLMFFRELIAISDIGFCTGKSISSPDQLSKSRNLYIKRRFVDNRGIECSGTVLS